MTETEDRQQEGAAAQTTAQQPPSFSPEIIQQTIQATAQAMGDQFRATQAAQQPHRHVEYIPGTQIEKPEGFDDWLPDDKVLHVARASAHAVERAKDELRQEFRQTMVGELSGSRQSIAMSSLREQLPAEAVQIAERIVAEAAKTGADVSNPANLAMIKRMALGEMVESQYAARPQAGAYAGGTPKGSNLEDKVMAQAKASGLGEITREEAREWLKDEDFRREIGG